ncbi:MAG: DUF4010 domain-containing protein [Desulfurococcales archaeon]|nr:DUF4010 domain-containing protein [Desulfurococcales archaeon]
MEAAVTGQHVLRILVALLAGALIGLERERARLAPRSPRGDLPGLRSFGLLGVYGGLTGVLLGLEGVPYGERLLLAGIAGAGFLGMYMPYAYARYVRTGYTGVTTLIVMLVAYVSGVIVGLGGIIEGVSTSIAVTLVLAIKTPVERAVARISYEEILALLEISTLAIVLGPVIKAYAPVVAGIDLYKVYLFFVIVLALSFTSYVIARIYGVKGLVYAAILGGLVNSEATIGSLTSMLKDIGDPWERRGILHSSVVLILAAMEMRASILLVAAAYLFLSPKAALEAAVYSSIAVAPAFIAALIAYGRARATALTAEGGGFEAQSPLNWGVAVKSAIAYLVLAVAVKAFSLVSRGAAIAVAVLGGLANAGAAILGLASAGSSLGVASVIAASLAAIGAAALNKPIYANAAALKRSEYLYIIMWSALLAAPPFAVAAALLLS